MTLVDLLDSIINGKYKRVAIINEDVSDDIKDVFDSFKVEKNNGYFIITKELAMAMNDYLSQGLYKNQTEYDFARSLDYAKRL